MAKWKSGKMQIRHDKIGALLIALMAAGLAFGDNGWMAGGASPEELARYKKFRHNLRTASVHDPSIFQDRDGKYYIVGTHMASAESPNLIGWHNTDTLRKSVDEETIAKIREYNADEKTGNWWDFLWAPDIIYNKKMRKYCLYLSANGDHWQSNIVLLTSDKVTGPFTYAGTVVYGGFTQDNWRQTDVPHVLRTGTLPARYIEAGVKNGKWGTTFPNCIDPCVFYDDKGHLLMSYGSWSGGIFVLVLDEKTGLRDEKIRYATNAHSDAYFGKKIAGGAYVSGEGSYILHFGGYYWLFISYGGLTAKAGYNVRVFRSTSPLGPYRDRKGNSAFYDLYRQNFNDSVGVRLFGAYHWPAGDGAMVAQGHNSAIATDDGRAYIVYHTRTTEGHEGHYIRVHQLFLNKDGWLVAAPFKMRGEKLEKRGLAKSAVAGNYEIILHRLDIDYANCDVVRPQKISLNADRTISGDFTGKWELERGTPYINITLDGHDTYRGVALVQAIDGTNVKTTVFTALGDRTQLTLWGCRER